MSDSEGGIIQPVGKSRLGKQSASSRSIYHPSKSQLIDWVNQTLLLGITRLEEFASGAVFCQMLDAHFQNVIPIHKVNFHAREEYEFVPNYKILQLALTELRIHRDIAVEKLMRGSPAEILELLQFLYKLLKKQKMLSTYDPAERRLRSVKGGTDRIPMPYWMNSNFDTYGRPEGGISLLKHSREDHSTGSKVEYDPYDSYVEAGRRSRTSRTPNPSPSNTFGRTSRQTPHTRTASVDSKNYPTQLSAAMREMQGNRSTLQDSMELQIVHNRSHTIGTGSSRSPAPVNTGKQSLRSLPGPRGTPPPSPKMNRTPPISPKIGRKSETESSFRSLARTGESTPPGESSRRLSYASTGTPAEAVEEALVAVRGSLDALNESVPCFDELLKDYGSHDDNYAYRGKLHSMKDVIKTLIRHNNVLISSLEQISRQSPEEYQHAFRGFAACVDQIRHLEAEFDECKHKMTELETRNPVPHSTSLKMTEEQKQMSDMRAVDSVLRKIGAAQASIDSTFQGLQRPKGQPSSQTTGGSSSRAITPQVKIEEEVLVKTTNELGTSSQSERKTGDYQIRRLRNGDIYKGHYQNSKKNGLGVYQFLNGDVYQGEFCDDRMSGHGVYIFINEGRYEGQWKKSVYEGAGNESFARGSTYHGEYSNGVRDGWGTCRYYNGDYYEGQWKNGLREGRGMQQCIEESKYVGDYLAGKRHGYGCYSFPNNDRYLGEYECDIPHGYGVYIFSTGQKYEGQWEQGKKHGWCIYTIETGEMWAGEWIEGKPKWVQGLTNNEDPDPRWPQEIVEKVEKAWIACRRARDSADEGSSRADDHWKADGEIQAKIKEAKAKTNLASAKAQEVGKEAVSIADTLDMLAEEDDTK